MIYYINVALVFEYNKRVKKLIFKIKEILEKAEKFEKSNNFYFQKHICNDNEIKINFNYKIKNENTDEIVMFGYCDKCKTVFHNKDFSSDSL